MNFKNVKFLQIAILFLVFVVGSLTVSAAERSNTNAVRTETTRTEVRDDGFNWNWLGLLGLAGLAGLLMNSRGVVVEGDNRR